jgi:hypothetical protein
MHPTIYHCMNRVWTREELWADAEAAGQDPERWIGGEHVFGDCVLTGHIENVDTDPE